MSRIFLFIFLIYFASSRTFGSPNSSCEIFKTYQNTVVYGIATAGSCMIYVTPKEKQKLRFRSYVFSPQGALLVFNSYGPGGEKSQSGSRTFFFLPRPKIPNFRLRSNGDLRVMLASGRWVDIDTESTRLKRIQGSQVSEDPNIDANNRGGVEILQSAEEIWIDAGYKTGDVAYSDPNGISIAHLGTTHACAIPNGKLFSYARTEVRLNSDEEVRLAVHDYCEHGTAESPNH